MFHFIATNCVDGMYLPLLTKYKIDNEYSEELFLFLVSLQSGTNFFPSRLLN